MVQKPEVICPSQSLDLFQTTDQARSGSDRIVALSLPASGGIVGCSATNGRAEGQKRSGCA
jgi:hypothetical protein